MKRQIHIHQTYQRYKGYSQHPEGEEFSRLLDTERLTSSEAERLPTDNGSYWATPCEVIDNYTYHREYRQAT